MDSAYRSAFAGIWAALLLAAAPAGADAVPEAQARMRLTCYMDGVSCPGGCDAHVVFQPKYNSASGSLRNAYAAGTRSRPRPCQLGEACTICFSSDERDCLTTTYRGSGPPDGKFDVTPAFLHEYCYDAGTFDVKRGLLAAVQTECEEVGRGARALASKVNCIANPSFPACRQMMDRAEEAKREDTVLYRECLREGEATFNRGRSLAGQREDNCAYTKKTFSLGRHGTYHRLLPGACGDHQFVSPDGEDCCSADEVEDACVGTCSSYFK